MASRVPWQRSGGPGPRADDGPRDALIGLGGVADTGPVAMPAVDGELAALCRQLEMQWPGLLAAVHVKDPGGRRWQLVVAPSVPWRWWMQLHSAPVGPTAGACGEAVARRERVIVADAATDPLYAVLGRTAQVSGLGACWATPLFSRHREVLGVLAIYARRGRQPRTRELQSMDVTASLLATVVARHRQLRSLERIKGRTSAIVEDAAIGIAVSGASDRLVSVNAAFCDLLGFTRADLVGTACASLIHPEDRDRALVELDKLGSPDTGRVRYELRYVRKDGTAVWVRVTSWLVADAAGAATRRVQFAEDISDRQRDEAALRRTAAHLAEAQMIGRTGSWVMDAASGLLLWSREMFRIFGFDPAAGQPTLEAVFARIHAQDRASVRENLQVGVLAGASVSGTHRISCPDGTTATVQYAADPVLDTKGRLIEYVGTVRDITDEQRVRDALHASLAELRSLAARQIQAQDEERRRIARNLHVTTAQDIAALKLNLRALERSGVGHRPRTRALLEESTALADRTLTDIRTLSYLLHPPFLDEVGLVSAVRWYATGFAKRSGLEVQLELPDEVLRYSHEAEITLFRVVQECVINIHRHSQSRRAAIRLQTTGVGITVEVQDWGRGMPVAPSHSVVDGSTLGVGIAGMRERILQLSGTLEIISGPRGTTVRAMLPVAPCPGASP